MNSLYTEGPTNIPDSLTKPSKKFKYNVTLAILGLILFIVTYLSLTIWFGYNSYHLFASLGGENSSNLLIFVLAFLIGILSIFMFKSLFIFTKRDKTDFQYLTPESEPVLFDFIYKLADQAGAPRPHKVITTSRVNAAVFYDLSIFNLLFPSKKNLEIGLGLVNTINMGEFKAILAHEFGHFAQKSMLLGRYVYVANQIAVRIVNKRDALDGFLIGLSRFDFRIAWVGWILLILVWAIRSLIEVLFSVVVIAERALSREMEFQADLIAVSLTGSDDLINGLHKLRGADEAYNSSINIVNEFIGQNKKVPDLFSLQTYYLEQMRLVLDDKSFGATPSNFRAGHETRIFSTTGINPPEMWATHPSDVDRENNAKQHYIPSLINKKSTWELFNAPVELRQSATKAIYDSIEKLPECELISEEEANLKMKTDVFNWKFLKNEYKGIYRDRFLSIYVDEPEELFTANSSDSDLKKEYSNLYPDSLKLVLDDLKEFNMEHDQLKATMSETFTAEKREIYFRGDRIKRSKIKKILKIVEAEIIEKENILTDHDKRVRSLNLKVAKNIGSKESDYYKQLLGLLHYCEHSSFNIQNKFSHFHTDIELAQIGNQNDEKLNNVIRSANYIGDLIEKVYEDSKSIITDGLNNQLLIDKPYAERFEAYGLGHADSSNISSWVENFNGWHQLAVNNINVLRNACLEQILSFEESLKNTITKGTQINIKNTKLAYPENYSKLKKGTEENKEFKPRFWDRFLAGYGLFPKIAKFVVAGSMILAVIIASNISTKHTLYINNGLDTKVSISMDGNIINLLPFETTSVPIKYGYSYSFKTTNANGELIEMFNGEVDERKFDYIYNVAGACFLNEYEVNYGFVNESASYQLLSDRWIASNANYIFSEAPDQLMLKEYETTTKKVISSLSKNSPTTLGLSYEDPSHQQMMIQHALWDDKESTYLMSWLFMAAQIDTALSFTTIRIERNNNEVESYRIIQDYGNDKFKNNAMKRVQENLINDPKNSNLTYLKLRFEDDTKERDLAFEKVYNESPNNKWLQMATAYTLMEGNEWNKAYDRLLLACESSKSIQSYYGLLLERIRRLIDPEFFDTSVDIEVMEDVMYFRKLEQGDEEYLSGNADEIFYQIQGGYYGSAISNTLNYDSVYRDYAMVMIAASVNGPADLIQEVFNWEESRGLSYNSIWAMIGLKIKHNQAYSNELEFLGLLINDDKVMTNITEFIEAISNNNLRRAKVKMKDIKHYMYKAFIAVTAYVVLEDKTPKEWKLFASQLLFINERPNFIVD